jgi:hypothetical protein
MIIAAGIGPLEDSRSRGRASSRCSINGAGVSSILSTTRMRHGADIRARMPGALISISSGLPNSANMNVPARRCQRLSGADVGGICPTQGPSPLEQANAVWRYNQTAAWLADAPRVPDPAAFRTERRRVAGRFDRADRAENGITVWAAPV